MLLHEVRGKRGSAALWCVWGSCFKAGLGALPGVGLSPGAALGDISRQLVSNSPRHCLIRSNVVQMLPL